jgi:hypothetical protein
MSDMNDKIDVLTSESNEALEEIIEKIEDIYNRIQVTYYDDDGNRVGTAEDVAKAYNNGQAHTNNNYSDQMIKQLLESRK